MTSMFAQYGIPNAVFATVTALIFCVVMVVKPMPQRWLYVGVVALCLFYEAGFSWYKAIATPNEPITGTWRHGTWAYYNLLILAACIAWAGFGNTSLLGSPYRNPLASTGADDVPSDQVTADLPFSNAVAGDLDNALHVSHPAIPPEK